MRLTKEEKEAIVKEYIQYWALVERIRDVVMSGLDEVSISDVISVLDRVKTELIQQETLVAMDEEMQAGAEETAENESVSPAVVERVVPDVKAGMLLKNIDDIGELSKEMKERINT